MPLPFVRTLVHRDALDSTSTFARHLLAEKNPELPLLVRADRQTAGRGRGANVWWSDEGSLTFTLGLDPATHGLKTEHEPRLALAAAVAVIEAIEDLAPDVMGLGIRWPNDVEAQGRKLGGILPERVETPSGPRLLVGIGLNVTTRYCDAPPSVRQLASSLAALRRTGADPLDFDDLLRATLARLEAILPELARDDPGLARRWAARDTLADQTVRIDLGPRLIMGIGRGLDSTGGLRLATELGIETIYGGRVLRD